MAPSPVDTAHRLTERTEASGGGDTSDDKGTADYFANYILSERPNVKWDDVAGLEEAKDALKQAVLGPPFKGILLFGPPGTGRSLLAKAVASESNSTLFAVSASYLVAWMTSNRTTLVKRLFAAARENAPAVIFVDDTDQLWGTRRHGESEASRAIKAEFLAQMNPFEHDNSGILILGASHVPWELDNDIDYWFEKRIYTPLPDAHARTQMIELNVGTTPHELTQNDFRELGQMADGYSGADIAVVVRDALVRPVHRILEATHFKPVDAGGKRKWSPCSPGDPEAVERSWEDIAGDEMVEPPLRFADFVLAIRSMRPSVTQDDVRRIEAWMNTAGHGSV